MIKDAKYWIEKLGLQAHPEGGYFTETYRAHAPDGGRAASTGIYFLIETGNISRFHRIDADEMWHFHAGDPLIVHMINEQGTYRYFVMGPDPEKGQQFQAVVPAGVWFGAELMHDGQYSLVGCTVAPGFEFDGFELAEKTELLRAYPEHRAIIEKLT